MNTDTKILIVDDAELYRMKIFCMLEDNFKEENLIFADSIETAWEKLIKNTIDVVLLDIYLPGENGTDLINDMLSNKRLKDIPIIVITGTREDSIVKTFYKKHVNSYLHKPIKREELLEAIAKCTNSKPINSKNQL